MAEINPELIRYILTSTTEKTSKLPEHKREQFKGIQPRITVLWGLRGAGKTTLLLQHLKENNGLYFKMDHFLFSSHKLYDIIRYFNSHGHTSFYLDEIHTYPEWYKELKDIYDDFKVNITASGSSAIALSEGESYLGRRAQFLHIPPLSFREYAGIKYNQNFPKFKVEEILENPQELLAGLEARIKNIGEEFNYFLDYGGLPIVFSEDFHKSMYIQVINRVITDDLLYFNISRETILKVKKVIPFLAQSKPGEVNFDSISSSSGIPKGTLYIIFDALKKAGLIQELLPYSTAAHTALRKLPKVYFAHPSLRHNILEDMGGYPNIGAYREEFMFSALKGAFGEFGYTKGQRKNPDFITEKYIFEVGGPGKRKKDYPQKTIIVQDSLNAPVPLILFGFV